MNIQGGQRMMLDPMGLGAGNQTKVLWESSQHVVCRHTCRQNAHTHKIKF